MLKIYKYLLIIIYYLILQNMLKYLNILELSQIRMKLEKFVN